MAINLSRALSIARAVLGVIGAGALVAIGYVVYRRIRSDHNGNRDGGPSAQSVIRDNSEAREGLAKAMAILRAARARSGS